MSSTENSSNGNHPQFTMFLILSILQLLCCNTITGVIALIFTIIGNTSYNNGDIEDADHKIHNAKLALIIGVVISVVISVLYGILVGAGIVSGINA